MRYAQSLYELATAPLNTRSRKIYFFTACSCATPMLIALPILFTGAILLDRQHGEAVENFVNSLTNCTTIKNDPTFQELCDSRDGMSLLWDCSRSHNQTQLSHLIKTACAQLAPNLFFVSLTLSLTVVTSVFAALLTYLCFKILKIGQQHRGSSSSETESEISEKRPLLTT